MTIPIRKINHIFVIQCLPAGETPTGKHLYDDVIKRRIDYIQSESIKMTHHFFDTNDKNTFIDAIKYIQANAMYLAGGILIHLETHGSNNRDGLILADGSLLNWEELVTLFRPINISTCNKLFVSMATCYGRDLYLGIDPHTKEKSPYQAYISANSEVMPNEVLEKFSVLFEILIECGDLVNAYLEHEKTDSPFFYKDYAGTFQDAIRLQRQDLDTNQEYKNSVLNHPEIHRLLESGEVDQGDLDYILKLAFNAAIKRQSETFNFRDCD